MSNKHGMNWITKIKRLAIYNRDGHACAYCGQGVVDGVILTLDHITPRVEGGGNEETNLITACKGCNSFRQDRNITEFVTTVANYVAGQATPEAILAYIAQQTAQSLKPFITEAKAQMSRQSDWKKLIAGVAQK